MRRRTQALVGDRSVERRQIDRPHRLRAEHEGIVALALAVDLRFDREPAKPVETRLRARLDPAVEQMHRGEVARILERAAEREDASGSAVVVLRGPVISLAGAPATD